MKKHYIKDSELTKEIIICKAKGQPSRNLQLYLYEICRRVNMKFSYKNEDIRYDIIMNSFMYVLNNYKRFNELKYSKSVSYITELTKRNQAHQFNRYRNHYFTGKVNGEILSLDSKIYSI